MKQIILKRSKDESLRRFHPWVFSGAISHFTPSEPEEGEVVEVMTYDGQYIATGHFQIGSIMVRILSFDHETIDINFYERRLRSALSVRQCIGLADDPDNNTYRLVHGEGDNLSGLVIDIYGRTAVMQAHSVGMHIDRKTIAEALANVMQGKIDNIFYKSETTLPFKADLGQENGFLLGGSKEDVATENGLKFHVDWLRGQKTGFFVDQRMNRQLLEHYSHGRRVLNMFCYTGGFSFYAMRGGATLVHSVDSSQKAIDLTNANVSLNFPDDPRHTAYCDDAFRFLDSIQTEMTNGESVNGNCPYDLIILDPPAFAKHKNALHNALKGYTRLNQKAFEKLPSGGLLFTFSCSQVVTKDQFRAAVFTAAAQAHRRVRILHQLHQPPDHPINIYHPEGEYLKGLVLYVE
ncbi:MAG: class I SAM-dependent rRNA methyltransferase [Bacteroidaceae bacterium]|nr:class I SAM-dependent rRNA methyltransferase [Bacteroidaceae bacterium]